MSFLKVEEFHLYKLRERWNLIKKMTSSCFESDSDSSVDSCSGVQRFTYEFKEKLRQNIKSNDKKQLELKRLGDSINKLQRNDKLKKRFC